MIFWLKDSSEAKGIQLLLVLCCFFFSLNEVVVGFRLFCLGEPNCTRFPKLCPAASWEKDSEGFDLYPTEVRIHHEYRTFLADVG